MTRKDFELIAKVFAGTRPNSDKLTEAKTQWNYDMHVMADALARTNPAFNREYFYKACLA